MNQSRQLSVLFVDDEPSARTLYQRRFERESDIEPHVAGDATDALRTLADDRIDCVVTDSIETDDGTPLIEVLSEEYPELPAVVYSGRPRDQVTVGPDGHFVEKGRQDGPGSSLERVAETVRSAAREHDGESDWETAGPFTWHEPDDVVFSVLEVLAESTDRDPQEMPILYDVIDTDSLGNLLVDADPTVVVTFDYDGHLIRVTGDGRIEFTRT